MASVNVNKGIFIIGAKRTPFCAHGGLLREMPASHAFAAAAKDAIHAANLDANFIDTTVVGNVHYVELMLTNTWLMNDGLPVMTFQVCSESGTEHVELMLTNTWLMNDGLPVMTFQVCSESGTEHLSQCDGGKTPRHCGLYAGVPRDRPALGVGRACGSGLQAVITGAIEILTASAKISLTGGTEIMSALPMLVRGIRFGASLGSSYKMEDHVQRELLDSYVGLTSLRMAEELAKRHGVSREDADSYTLQSHMRWKAAHLANVFTNELTPLTATVQKKQVLVDQDAISRLFTAARPQEPRAAPPLLEGGSVLTAANSAAPADGAAAIILADEDSVRKHKLTPLARVVGWSCVGVDPAEAGLGAARAVRSLVKRLDAVDLFEINEVSAAETLVTARQLGVGLARVNAGGGALALGRPAAAAGAALLTRLVYELSRRGARTAVAAASCGGGQGVAVLLEKV